MSHREQQVDPKDPKDPEVRYAATQIEELSRASYAGVEQGCDVVMKGGITSGVVYPLTICRLATRYRLRSVGGTSAGAIAAGLAAAAEFRRRCAGPGEADAGYRMLAQLPQEIAPRLEDLFQARPDTRRLFSVLDAAIDPGNQGVRRWAAVVSRIVAGKVWWFVGGFAATLALAVPGLVVATGFPVDARGLGRILVGLVLPSLLAGVVGVLVAVVGLLLEAGRVLPRTGFGLTDGATHEGTPALTDWLADKIDQVAGIDNPQACLTLGDLWGEKGVAAWKAGSDSDWVKSGPMWRARETRRISLEVMTTDLTVRRPFRMPFSTQAFMFARSEWERLFPPRVVATMARDEFRTGHVHPETGESLYWFPGPGSAQDSRKPGPEHLPVIVMVRMSLSFPGLISAIPLYAVDFNGDQSVVRHWFSDGGVSSNFPMHFFDALLPTRPTFGVDLSTPHPLHPDSPVWRPAATSGGTIPRAHPFAGIAGFLGALFDTMQNWADTKQVTQRGYADRVVEIRLGPDEGGMNLGMSTTRVLKLTARGALAGESLLGFDWAAHRVVRYRTAMARLSDGLDHLRHAWRAEDGALYPAHLASYPGFGAPGSSYLGGRPWRAADLEATEALVATVEGWDSAAWPATQVSWPQPAPQIRMAPE